jgi:hypothetical protein
MLHRVALIKPDVSEELSASFIMVTRIGELGKTVALTSNRRTLRRKVNQSEQEADGKLSLLLCPDYESDTCF